MNVIEQLTLASVKKNKKRSIATVIAVILSTALICGTAGLCTSGIKSFQQSAVWQVGDFHLTVEGVPRGDLPQITENAQVKESFFSQSLGYAKLQGSRNDEKPYVYVYALSSRALSGGWGLHLISGRMPENENEPLVSDHIRTNARVEWNVGDTLTLSLGQRMLEGYVLNQSNPFTPETPETIENAQPRTFTVVGVVQRPDRALEGFTAPGYSCFTFASDEALAAADPVNVSFTLKDARSYGRFSETLYQNLSSYGNVIENTDLLEYSGALSRHTLDFIFSVGVIVTLIIMLTSVFVIRNSFAISVSEKTKQYGILASVGATSKQIRRSVLFEGLLFGLAGVPLGVGSGVFAIVVLLKVVNVLLGDLINGLVFVYYLPPVFALVSAVLAAVTIFFSAFIPAYRAGKIPPIEAVRGNREVNIRGKEVRVSRFTQKLFGIGGVIAAKNLKRSRKKYRTTVVSLVLSVTVFISLASFVGYMKKSVSNKYEKVSFNLAVNPPENADDCEALYKDLAAAADIGEYAYYRYFSAYIRMDAYGTAAARAEARRQLQEVLAGLDPSDPETPPESFYRDLYDKLFLVSAAYNDAYFSRYLASLGVSETGAPQAVLCDLNGQTNIKDGTEVQVYFAQGEPDGADTEYSVLPVKIAKVVSNGHPTGLEGYDANTVCLILPQSFFTEKQQYLAASVSAMRMMAPEPSAVEARLQELITSDARFSGMSVYNQAADGNDERRIILIAEIFLYGFITVITLIGVTNIFNTITTNMNLRQKEFAMLKSVGMTKREFNRMVRLESVMYGLKSLLIGVPLGILGGIAFYVFFHDEFRLPYVFPWASVLLSAVFVFIIVGLTMRYSLGKINKQNIIETIRNENT